MIVVATITNGKKVIGATQSRIRKDEDAKSVEARWALCFREPRGRIIFRTSLATVVSSSRVLVRILEIPSFQSSFPLPQE
jgi:hypothetical protein